MDEAKTGTDQLHAEGKTQSFAKKFFGLVDKIGTQKVTQLIRNLRERKIHEPSEVLLHEKALQLMDNKKKLKLFLSDRFDLGFSLYDFAETSPKYFIWLMENKLGNRDIFDLQIAYNNSPEGAKLAINGGYSDKDCITISYKYSKAPEMTANLLQQGIETVTHVWQDDTINFLSEKFQQDEDLFFMIVRSGKYDENFKDMFDFLSVHESKNNLVRFCNYFRPEKMMLRNMIALIKENPEITDKMMVEGIHPGDWEKIMNYEKDKPDYSSFTIFTHTQRLNHFEIMVKTSEEVGLDKGMCLRSMAENILHEIKTEPNSPSGRSAPGGESMLSTKFNSVAGYGEIAWVVLPENQFSTGSFSVRVLDTDLEQVGLESTQAEVSILTSTGDLIEFSRTLKYLYDNDQWSTFSSNHYKEILTKVFRDFPDLNPDNDSIPTLFESTSKPSQDEFEKFYTEVLKVLDTHKDKYDGIKLCTGSALCMVPKEQLRDVTLMIENSNLSDHDKQILLSQIIPYEAIDQLEELFALKNNKENFLSAICKTWKVIFNDQSLTNQQVGDTLTIQEARLRKALVKDYANCFRIAEYPTPKNTFDVMDSEDAFALLHTLKQKVEWSFLKDVPKIAEGILIPILQEIWYDFYNDPHESRTRTVQFQQKMKDTMDYYSKIFTSRQDSLTDQEAASAKIALKLDAIDTTSHVTVWDKWKKLHVFTL